jgi:hypothetical protein
MWKTPIVVVFWYYTNIHFGGLKEVRDTAEFAGTGTGTFPNTNQEQLPINRGIQRA